MNIIGKSDEVFLRLGVEEMDEPRLKAEPHRCVAGVYPEVGFAPYVQNSCTDSREFNEICDRVYRFCGFVYSAEARTLLHAPNERIGVDVYKRGIEFYVAFLGHLADL